MDDLLAVLTLLGWLVPVALLAYLCWTTTNILRGLHRIHERMTDSDREPGDQ